MTNQSIDDILKMYHKNQYNFIQAVHEIYNDIDFKKLNITKKDIDIFFKRLIEPDRTIRFKIEWYDDNNHLQVNRGYRIQFNNSLGPYKGGLRFHPSVSEDTFKFLGFEQIFKNALTGLPMGGAKGGSDFDPKGKSKGEILRFCHAFMNKLYKHIGANVDIPAGDIGVSSREIGFLYGQYVNITGQYTGVMTGKDPSFGGSYIRKEATGYGAAYFFKRALKQHDISIKDLEILVSGSGNVALHLAEKLIELNSKVLTLSDSNGTLYFKDGINSKDLNEIKDFKLNQRGRLEEFKSKNSEYLKNKKPWGIKADCAFPCATQNEINIDEANQLINNGTYIFCEGANMPLTSEAIQSISNTNEFLYIPGKAINAGGVAISGIERTQNANHSPLSYQEVDLELKEIMKTIHNNCLEYIDTESRFINYKKGANLFAFKKVYEATTSLNG